MAQNVIFVDNFLKYQPISTFEVSKRFLNGAHSVYCPLSIVYEIPSRACSLVLRFSHTINKEVFMAADIFLLTYCPVYTLLYCKSIVKLSR